jgi:uncharacterized protein (DUF433 family)
MIEDFPELNQESISAVLYFAACRESSTKLHLHSETFI